jgi:coenzyme F420-reducing hydrogenase beta subunit
MLTLNKTWQSMQEVHDFPNGGWMLHSNDTVRRNQGASGGVVTELTRYLLDESLVRTALGFAFHKTMVRFVPKWVYTAEEVVSVGSIYHEVPLVQFMRRNLDGVHPPLLIVALPCQVKAVRALCEKAKIPVHVISLVCSGQMTLDATRELVRRVADGRQVVHYQYRGGGWPGGVRVKYSDGSESFVDNNRSLWADIFHAGVFNLSRCFRCKDTFGIQADMTVGDPWLPRYIEGETLGVSMCIPHTRCAITIMNDMLERKRLVLREIVSSPEVVESQRGTIKKKAVYLAHPRWVSMLRALYRRPWYVKRAFSQHLGVHLWFHRLCMHLLSHF